MKRITTMYCAISLFALLLLAGCAQTVKQVPNFEDIEDTQMMDHSELMDGGVAPTRVGLAEGMLPPDFELTLSDGSSTTLRSLANNDKPVIIYFMATWCPYCGKDFASLSELYPEYSDDVEILAFSLDLKESQSLLDEYKTKYVGLDNMVLSPGSKDILSKYGVRHTTTKYAIGKDGTVAYAGSGPLSTDQWRTLLETLTH